MKKAQVSWLLSFHILSLFSTINNTVLVDGRCLNDQRNYLLQLKDSLEFDLQYSTKLVEWSKERDCCSWRGVDCDASGRVTTLYLNDESITGGADSFASLFKLQFLEELNLEYNNINHIPIPKAIANLTSLVSLDLSHSGFVGPLPGELSSIRNLSVIILNGNNISAEVPESFANLSNLKVLSLFSCNLQGKFPGKIFQISTLETLDISDNKLLQGSLSPFPKNSSLRTLVLSSTSFSGSLPDSIGNLYMLSIIDLSDCMFNGTIPAAFRDLKQVSYVNLSVNNFSGSLPELQSFENLVDMDLSHNRLTGSMYATHFEGVLRLETLNLGYNFLSGSLPSSIFELPTLRALKLPHNEITGGIPSSIGKWNHLRSLDLSRNQLDGEIPSALEDLGLSYLNLSFNILTGEIPTRPGLRTFSSDSYIGNVGLCGYPLDVSCDMPSSNKDINWMCGSLGYFMGLYIFFTFLLLCVRWRNKLFLKVDQLLVKVFGPVWREPIRRL